MIFPTYVVSLFLAWRFDIVTDMAIKLKYSWSFWNMGVYSCRNIENIGLRCYNSLQSYTQRNTRDSKEPMHAYSSKDFTLCSSGGNYNLCHLQTSSSIETCECLRTWLLGCSTEILQLYEDKIVCVSCNENKPAMSTFLLETLEN